LDALAKSTYTPAEIIVIDDGSTDGTPILASESGAIVVSTGGPYGPARARNLGARVATGDVLVFIDSDVAIHSDALERINKRFLSDEKLDALVGSYDDAPAHPGFVSQFKNLMHSFVHHSANRRASTFWCGCGAVKRNVFLAHGGLNESYRKPSIEDIELGFRMLSAARKIIVDSTVQCKHLKHWTFWTLLQTDIFLRGIPWTELILRTGSCPDDLNLRWSERIAASISGLLMILLLLLTVQLCRGPALIPIHHVGLGILLCLGTILIINRTFYSFLASRKGWRFSCSVFPLHVLYYLYSVASFVLGTGVYLVRSFQTPPTSRRSSDPLMPIL
jgi:GT2 family glycosyltransferase